MISFCSSVAKRVERPAAVDELTAFALLLGESLDGFDQMLRIGVHRIDQFVHHAEEVWSQPGDSGELRPVGALVDGHPETELLGRESVPLFE